MNIIDQDGYELVKRNRRLGQYMAEIFAVEAEGSGDSIPKELSETGDSIPKELSKQRLCGESCSKEL